MLDIDHIDLEKLREIVRLLRGDEGCPWDREQTHESLKPYLIEETYEVLEAIDYQDSDALCEELGDILLHVVFHAQLAEESQKFTLDDVIQGIGRKMIRRHPHVFGGPKAASVAEVWSNWDKIKKTEKSARQQGSVLNNVPKALPSLYRADKLQRRAARLGFDWDNVAGAWEKVYEELAELKDIYESDNLSHIKEEIGDLLFSIVNVARKLNIDAEESLRDASAKFMRRFYYLEQTAMEQGRDLLEMSLAEMDQLWEEGKRKSC